MTVDTWEDLALRQRSVQDGTHKLVGLVERGLLYVESIRHDPCQSSIVQDDLPKFSSIRQVSHTGTYHRVGVLCQPSHGKEAVVRIHHHIG